ncbi:MAG: MFS transporter [Myxococcaceae bacterium]|nr:MFS transporter [Myxococcaceae bacterium]
MDSALAAERRAIFVIGAVQFVNVLDFVMVMPMGPDFSQALGIPLSHIGYIGGAYTAAAAVSGFVGSFFLERFDRKQALLGALLGLVAGTALGGLAVGLSTLMAARMVAGAFGGPATSISMSMVADLVPPERRGRAMGAVMSAFSIASVLGVPAGLVLAMAGWRFPFFVTAGIGVIVAGIAARALPSMRAHLQRQNQKEARAWAALLGRPTVWLSWTMTAVVMMAGFIVIPNISSYVQENLHFPRAGLSVLYLVGGVVSFFAMRLSGRLVDRIGSFRTGAIAAVLMVGTLYLGFVRFPWPLPRALTDAPWTAQAAAWLPVILLFTAFMAINSLRNVAYNTLTSKVPGPHERARFMSIQSAVQHIASAIGAFLSARLLWELPDGALGGVDRIAFVSMGLTAVIPLMLYIVESRVVRPAMDTRVGVTAP